MGESLIGTMLDLPNKTKDELKAHKDLESLGLKPDLLQKTIEGDRLHMPASSYTLTPEAKGHLFADT